MEERDDTETIDVTFHPQERERADPARPDYAVAPHPHAGEQARDSPWPAEQRPSEEPPAD
jgi:hypothetical protein